MAPRDITAGNSIVDVISHYTGASVAVIATDAKLDNIGLDSIAAVQLADELLARFKLVIHPDEVFGLSLSTLRNYITDPRSQVTTNLAESVSSATPKDAANPIAVPKPHQVLPNPFIALAQSNNDFENAAKQSGYYGYWENIAPLQNDLLLAYITEAFDHLGIDLSEYPHGIEIPPIQHIPKYSRLMKRLLSILESRYIITQRGGKVLRGSDRIDVPPSSSLCQALRTQHPLYACEADLLGLVGPKLADCLSGKVDPVSILFGSAPSLSIIETFYAKAPMMAALTTQLLTFLISFLRSTGYSQDHPIRILEVGGGTGATTVPLAEALTAAGITVEYRFTDVGPAFVSKVKARLGKLYPWMSFQLLNLEHEMPAAFQGKFDITIGVNVVHATSDRLASCRRLRETLRPDGLLVLSEITRVIDWYDICFGLLDGWWVSDGGRGYPIQPAEVWMEAFESAGFRSMDFSTGMTEEANSQQLLVACNQEWSGASSSAM